jgi:hypothetical protein
MKTGGPSVRVKCSVLNLVVIYGKLRLRALSASVDEFVIKHYIKHKLHEIYLDINLNR